MQRDERISAYDLARDIVRELEAGDVATITGGHFGFFSESWVDLDAALDEAKAAQVIEAMIRQAIKNGGIRP